MELKLSHYTILEELGRGGMGIVYKARDERLDRIVALKVLARELTDDPKSRERFMKEARLASSLRDPRICTIHEIDETEDGQLFISMDYYEGETLQQKIYKGIDSLDILLDYAIQIAEGVSVAHMKGIIHRDIKPGNVIITPKGEVRILDFGLAKLTGKYSTTNSSRVLGSVSYISPEQAKGSQVDHLSDIWSFGVVMYEMATGILPFASDFEAAVIFAILDKSPVPPTEINEEIPEELESFIYKCLRKDRGERLQSMEEVKSELLRIRESLKKSAPQIPETAEKRSRQAERRLATLLVAEIDGYHEMMAKLEEEEADQVMTRIFENMNGAAREYGAIITGRTDHRFTLVFGTTGQGENAPVQAINAAISLRIRTKEIDLPKKRMSLNLKIGVNTGMVIFKRINAGDKEEYAVTGDALALTHQLCNMTEGGEILTGPLTYRNTSMLFDYKSLKPISISGNSEPVPVFMLFSNEIRDVRKTVRLDWLIQSEMVGRQKEMEVLEFHLMKLIHEGGSIVNVIGEAGVGKSRLIAEFIKKEKSRNIKIIQGRARSAGETLSFHPIIDTIRNLAAIQENDDEQTAFRKLEQTVQKFCDIEAEEVLPFIATLMGMNLTEDYANRLEGLEGEGLEKLIMKNMRTLIMGASSQLPVVVILEDLHWADQSSIQLLKSLYRLVETHPILYINVFRPDYLETAEKVRVAISDRHEGQYTELLLQPLDDRHSEILIKELLKTRTLQPEIKSLIYGQSEGNPLYMEEIIRSLIDDGIITRKEHRLIISDRISSTMIPGTINDVLMSRIDKLEEDARTMVRVASVIGRHFYHKILVQVIRNETAVNRILEQLTRTQLIRQSHRAEEVEYLFKHALIHQAAYNTILPGQRKELHLKVGRAIEEIFKERIHDFYGILAYHYALGEDPERAESYLIKAGERASKSAASMEALHYFREALSIYLGQKRDEADPEKVARLNTYIGRAYSTTGHFIETAAYLEKVLNFYGARVPRKSLFLIPGAITGLMIFLIRLRFPVLMGRRIPTDKDIKINDLILIKINALSITESFRGLLETLFYAPRLTRYQKDHLRHLMILNMVFSFGGLSLATSKKILDYAESKFPADNLTLQMNLISLKCFHNLVAGNWLEEEYEDALMEHGFRIGELYMVTSHMGMQAHIYIERGDRQAVKVLDRLLEFAEIYEYNYGKLARHTHYALYRYKYQEYVKVLEMAPRGLEWIRDHLGNKPGRIMLYSIQIKALFMLGRYDKLEELYHEVEDLARGEQLVPYFESYFLTATLMFEIQKLEIITREGKTKPLGTQFRKARKAGRRALKTCKKIAYERVETYRLIGLSYWLIGKEQIAIKWWSRALSESEKLGARIERAVTMREVGRWFTKSGRDDLQIEGMDADGLNRQAIKLFKEMDIPYNHK